MLHIIQIIQIKVNRELEAAYSSQLATHKRNMSTAERDASYEAAGYSSSTRMSSELTVAPSFVLIDLI